MRAALLSLFALSACTIGTEDEPTVDQTCDSPQYGDGVCQADLACAVPDIDCLEVFEDDVAATAWFTEIEALLAEDAHRPPRAIVPHTDQRYLDAREWIDEGWESFRRLQPVGLLANERPALVVIDDPSINAFVMMDPRIGKAVFTVIVQTGLIEAPASKDARLWIMMHELQHAVGLHSVQETKKKMQKHYVATGTEPIGRDQVDNATVRNAREMWIEHSEDVGFYTNAELSGFPLTGAFFDIMVRALTAASQVKPTECARTVSLVNALYKDVLATDPLDGSLLIPLATVEARVNAALSAFKGECLGVNSTLEFIDVAAAVAGVSAMQVRSAMTGADLALVENRHFVDALYLITADRRTKMRAIEGMLPGGAPWSSLRFFSHEEDSDDVATHVIDGAGLEPLSGAEGMLLLVNARGGDAKARCQTMLDAGTVPGYGVNLVDAHHADCWRAYHVEQMASLPATAARRGTAEQAVLQAPDVSVRPSRFMPRPAPRFEILD